MIFALLGIVVALAVGGAFYYRQSHAAPARTPEETVREFLAAVFLANSAERVTAVTCATWDANDALIQTASQVEPGASVSWDQVEIISGTTDRANVRARLGIRLRDDVQPSTYRFWRFQLLDQDGWRVCDARPLTE